MEFRNMEKLHVSKPVNFCGSGLSPKRGILISMPSLKIFRFVTFIDCMSFLLGYVSCFAADLKIKTLLLPMLFPRSNTRKEAACACRVFGVLK